MSQINRLKGALRALWAWLKKIFARTIGDQPVESDYRPQISGNQTNLEPKPSKDTNKNKTEYKREWGPELYEYFVEHLLSINNYDPKGLTEKLTLAWLTPTAKSLRKASGKGWGPYGGFFSPYVKIENFHAVCILDLGITIFALGLVIPIVKFSFWFISLPLFYCGGYLIVVSTPEVDFWDGWYWSETKTWDEIYQSYDDFCDSKAAKTVAKLEPFGTDILLCQYSSGVASPEIEWGAPEWAVIARKKKINQTAAWLCKFIFNKNKKPKQLKKLLPPKKRVLKFSFKGWRDKTLLIERAREQNGQGVHFISCAFLAPRSVDGREREGWHWGPLHTLKWPFRTPGGLLRELILSFYMYVLVTGLLSFYYTYALGLVYLACSFGLVLIGIGGIVYLKKSVEDWFDEEVFGGIPAAYPQISGAHSYKYKIFHKEIKPQRLAPNPEPSKAGFMVYLSFFSNFFKNFMIF